MSSIDETQIKSDGLGHLIADAKFKVPAYQRSYSWMAANVDQFMVDIIESFHETQKEYFLGTIVLIDGKDGDFGIVDGQQRLATTSLLLAGICGYLRKNGEEKRADRIRSKYLIEEDVDLEVSFRLTLNGADNPHFTTLIENVNHKIKKSDPKAAQNMAAALTVINKHIASFTKGSSDPIKLLTDFVKYIQDKLRVIKIVVTNEASAFTIFETLNDRGLDLSVADLLKNFLFSHVGPEGIEEAKTHWATMTGTLNTVGDETMLPTFIRHYWISKHEAVTKSDLFKKIKQRVHTKSEALGLLKELSEASRDYASLQNPQHDRWRSLGQTTEVNVKTLNNLRFEQTRPLLMSILRNFNDASLPKVLEKMVHWSVRIQVAGDTRTGQFSEHLKNVIQAINASGSSVRTAKKLGEMLEKEGLIPSNKTFIESFTQITPRIPLARYYLIEIENAKRIEQGKRGELVPDDSPDNVNLEHILPLTIDAPTDWPDFTSEQASEYHGRLGNMAIFQAKENSKIGNIPFDEKKDYFKTSEIATTSELDLVEKWDIKAIETRQQEFARLATKAWPIK